AAVFFFAELLYSGTLDNKHCDGPPAGPLLGIELDDQRLAHGDIDLLTKRQVADRDVEAVGACLEPLRDLTSQGIDIVAHNDHAASLVLQCDYVAPPGPVGRDRDAPAVYQYVAVAYELPRLGAAGRPVGPEDHVVQAQLEHPEQVLT